jgi:hypothetical protein
MEKNIVRRQQAKPAQNQKRRIFQSKRNTISRTSHPLFLTLKFLSLFVFFSFPSEIILGSAKHLKNSTKNVGKTGGWGNGELN